MQIFSGIDEAGLGPILGPLTMALVSIEAPYSPMALLKKYQKKEFWVDDSKKIFTGKNGLRNLELNVLSFYHIFTNSIPTDLKEFIPSLHEPWYLEKQLLPIKVTREEILFKSSKIQKILKENNISIVDIKRVAISARVFNALVDELENKSLVTQEILRPLICQNLSYKGYKNLTIDKQGGRKFYKEYLDGITSVTIKNESDSSLYTYESGNILFAPKADSFDFSVALASMFAKYMREISMVSFNKYWKEKFSSIKPTAGYYVDGLRFINDLRANNIPINENDLIRKK